MVSNFILQALRNDPITVFGDGSQSRSFCYVDDLIEGLIKLMNTLDDFIGPINLGNPSEISMLELAEKILKITHSKSKVVFKPLSFIFNMLIRSDPKPICRQLPNSNTAT